MPGLKCQAGAWLVLALCAAPVCGARAAERDPVTGGLVSLPAPTAPAATAAPAQMRAEPAPAAPAPAPTAAPDAPAAPRATGRQPDDTSWGVVLRGGYFGLPDAVADEFFNQHPKIEGTIVGAELRYHGEGGGRGGASIGFAVDSGSSKTDGLWQRDDNDPPKAASGDIKLLAFTVTGYWTLFPSWYVHPYFGVGIGAANLKGSYQKDSDLVEVDVWIPALHLPVGVAVELGKRFQLSVEGRFVDGISAGGAFQVRF